MPTENVVSGRNAISVEDFLAVLEHAVGDLKQRVLASRRTLDLQSSTTKSATPEVTRSTSSNTNDAAQNHIAQSLCDKLSFCAILGHVIGPTLKVYDATKCLSRKPEDGGETEEETEEEHAQYAELGDAMEQWFRAVLTSKPFMDSVREAEGEENREA